MEILQRLNRETGLTVVLITHEPDIAEYAQRMVDFPRRPGRQGRARSPSAATPRPRCLALPPLEAEVLSMEVLNTLRIAFKALRRNKVRSALTTLGVIIGVASVIAMIALGSGRAAPSTRRSRARAPTSSTSPPAASGAPGPCDSGSGSVQTLTLEDATAIRDAGADRRAG